MVSSFYLSYHSTVIASIKTLLSFFILTENIGLWVFANQVTYSMLFLIHKYILYICGILIKLVHNKILFITSIHTRTSA